MREINDQYPEVSPPVEPLRTRRHRRSSSSAAALGICLAALMLLSFPRYLVSRGSLSGNGPSPNGAPAVSPLPEDTSSETLSATSSLTSSDTSSETSSVTSSETASAASSETSTAALSETLYESSTTTSAAVPESSSGTTLNRQQETRPSTEKLEDMKKKLAEELEKLLL